MRTQWASIEEVRAEARGSKLERTLARQIAEAGLPTPEREYRFHPERKWRFDFAWPVRMLAVEVEGGTFQGGRHRSMHGFQADAEKYNTAAAMGWTVLRFTALDIEGGTVTRTRQRRGVKYKARERVEATALGRLRAVLETAEAVGGGE